MSEKQFLEIVIERLKPFYNDDERLGALLGLSVGRLMVRSLRKTGSIEEFDDDRVQHVVDWLKAAVRNNAPWLSNLDDRGRPKKLLKYGRLENLLAEVDRSMLIEAQKIGKVSLIEGDEILYASLPDGMSLVRLMSPAALDRETAEMQHCIGNGGYDDLLGQKNYLLLSLRDRHGKAHATIEIKNDAILQIQGKQNRAPVHKYVDALIPFFQQGGFLIGKGPRRQGFITDRNGKIYLAQDFQPGTVFEGDLDLKELPIKELPTNLTIRGALSLCFSDLESLPSSLTVEGRLDLRQSKITSLPEGLTVGKDLIIYNIPIKTLPEGLSVGGGLNLFMSSVTSLPDNLYVGGTLTLCRTQIEALPSGMKVGGSLYLEDTQVQTLGDGLWVGKVLSLAGTRIRSLPKDLHVGKALNIAGTGIDRLPDTIAGTTEIIYDFGVVTAQEFRAFSAERRAAFTRSNKPRF